MGSPAQPSKPARTRSTARRSGPRDQDARGDGTALAAVHARRHRARQRLLEVGVVEQQVDRLAPSSRNVGLSADAASMIRRPVAVEPVKATMSTSGDVVMTSPTRWSPAHDVDDTRRISVCSATSRAIRAALNGVSGRRLRRRVAHRQDRAELVEQDLHREVPRDDDPHDADGLLPDVALGLVADAHRALGPDRPLHGNSSIIPRPQQRLARNGASSCGP